MSYDNHHNYFARAYKTGTDHWSGIPFNRKAEELVLYIPKGSMVLDLGTGRGRLLFSMAELGFKTIGLEYHEGMVKKVNSDIKERGLENTLRAIKGDALDIPLSDQGFDALVDIGLLQHLSPKHYEQYVKETTRVLKQGGFFYLIALSMKTPNHLAWQPSRTGIADYDMEGVNYHFFTDDEIRSLFQKDFEIKQFDYDMPYGPMGTIYSVVLMKKK